MEYRIHYVDSYKESKTLVVVCDSYYEAVKMSEKLGRVDKIEPINGSTGPIVLSDYGDDTD